MRNKILAASFVLFSLTASSSAFALGLWSESYFELSTKGTIPKGEAIDISSNNPKQTSSSNFKVKTDCYLHIGDYADILRSYNFQIVCKGKDGIWEITQYEDTALDELYPPSTSRIGSADTSLYMTTIDGTVWSGNEWRNPATDIVTVKYTGPIILEPKLDKDHAQIKNAKFTTVEDGAITWENALGVPHWKGGFKSGLKAKWVPIGKVDSEALNCLIVFASNDAGIHKPCDPKNNIAPQEQ